MEEITGTITIDHDEIRDWIEEKSGRPALASSAHARTLDAEPTPTRLRVVFGDMPEELEEVSWREFFKLFESEDLAFLYDPDSGIDDLKPTCSFVDRMEHMDQIENGGEVEEEDEELEEAEPVEQDEH